MTQPRTFARHRALIGLVTRLMVVAFATSFYSDVRASDEPTRSAPLNQPGRSNPAGFAGLRNCGDCHNAENSHAQLRLPGGRIASRGTRPLSRLDEFAIWASRDKHGQAFQALSTDRAKSMGKYLSRGEKTFIPHRDRRCLACHSGYPVNRIPGSDPLADETLVAGEKPIEDVIYGVTCEACHGPAAAESLGKRSWLTIHTESQWLDFSAKKKNDEFGFYDVRSPRRKAALCLSCHLGNYEEGRVLTHEMYAAGHPPLSGFELETFTEQMPKHWRTHQSSDFRTTKSLEICALVAVSANLRLTAQLAKSPSWPELAQFDCFACHHDLQDRGWRQSPRRTGRPLLHEWPDALARLVEGTLPAADPKSEKEETLLEMSDRTVFGDPRGWSEAAEAVAARFEKAAQRLEEQGPFSRLQAERLRNAIVQSGSDFEGDYDSARQLIWALRVIDQELNGSTPRAKDDPIQVALDAFGKIVLLDPKQTDRPEQEIKSPDREGRFRLREDDLGQTLPKIAQHNPELVREIFKRLRDAKHSNH